MTDNTYKNLNIGDKIEFCFDKQESIYYTGIVDDVYELSLTENKYKVVVPGVGDFYLNQKGEII